MAMAVPTAMKAFGAKSRESQQVVIPLTAGLMAVSILPTRW